MLIGERALGATFPLAEIGWIDFETQSRIATPQADGTYRYATQADAVILAWAIGDSEIRRTAVDDFSRPLDWTDLPEMFQAHHARVLRGEAIWAAWNAGFDKAIWNYATLGFPELEPHHIIDVMAQATAAGLPPDLAMASRLAGGAKKNERGKELIKHFCLPTSHGTPQNSPAEWQEFLDYAGDDIAAMRAVFKVTRQLSLAEWREYWAMEKINERGVGIDTAMVARAVMLASEDKTVSAQEIFTQTRGEVPGVDHVQLMTQWLIRNLPAAGRQILLKREEEIDEETGEIKRPAKFQLTRARITRLLAYCKAAMEDLDSTAEELARLIRAERVLQIRLYGGSKTPAKFAKMWTQALEGVLYGQYVFNGAAQTGRASSRGVQIHNLARDTLPFEHEAIEAVLGGIDYRNFAIFGDVTPVSRKLSLLIRPTFVPRNGNSFVWSDWSQIEARVLPWLAGDVPGALERLAVFRAVDADPSVPDIYTRTASVLSHLPIEEITKALRQRGKVAELALGFGGGLGALQAMGANYGLYVPEDEGRDTVRKWREANAWCVQFWEQLWDAITEALMNPEAPQVAGRLVYIYLPDYLGGSLLCMLPSGRCLTYRAIRYERVEVKDEDDVVTGHEVVLRFSRGYGRVKFWHGMACENVVQAVAADCLRGTLRRMDEGLIPVRLHTHDEILAETRDANAEYLRDEMRELMQRGFDWSDGLPLMSEETISPYYTKVEA